MDDLALLLGLLKQAGKVAQGFYRKHPKQWTKPDGSVVTEGDIAVDAMLKTTIRNARPDDGWLSEETPDTPDRLTKQRLWIADPIDGTRAFSEGHSSWGIGVALIENSQPIVSAIYCPVDDVMFHAVKNAGAFRNGVRLPLADCNNTVIVPRKAVAALEAINIPNQVDSALPMLLRFAAVADGRHAGAIAIGNKQDWDLAAGHLMVTETGGKVTTQLGEPLVYNRREHWQPGLVAAQLKWHDKLQTAVGKL
jgi:myo-inositol-1(or 4)-monophosphatase